MRDTLLIFAATGGLALLTWFTYRVGVDGMVERERFPRGFKVMIGLNMLLIAMGLIGGFASMFFHGP